MMRRAIVESIENTFNIKDTWLYMGLLAQKEESEVSKYIKSKKDLKNLTAQDIAMIEYASEIKSTLKETKAIFANKAMNEKGGQYKEEALDRLMQWQVISSQESEVMKLRMHHTYREIGNMLGIDPSTACRTVERVHERVKLLYKKVSVLKVEPNQACDQFEKNIKKIEESITSAHLSQQQQEIYKLLCQGYSDADIQVKLNMTSGAYRVQKCRINKHRKFLTMI